MASLVLTVLGDDRPGLVSTLSGPVEAAGGSWQRSQLARLAGKFAGVVLVSVPDDAVAGLEQRLVGLSADGLDVTVERAADDHDGSGEPAAAARRDRSWRLHLLGSDRPGIVAEVSAALAERRIGIDELVTDVHEAPMAGGMLFAADAVLALPAGVDVDEARAVLERLADELMVDLTLTGD